MEDKKRGGKKKENQRARLQKRKNWPFLRTADSATVLREAHLDLLLDLLTKQDLQRLPHAHFKPRIVLIQAVTPPAPRGPPSVAIHDHGRGAVTPTFHRSRSSTASHPYPTVSLPAHPSRGQ
jgi:hypothetical protein